MALAANKEDIIKSFPKDFKRILSDPKFAQAIQEDETLFHKCLKSFESEIADKPETERLEAANNNLKAFLHLIKTKIGGEYLSKVIIAFFEEKMKALAEDNDRSDIALATLLVLSLAQNPTTHISLLTRVEKAIGTHTSDNIETLKKTIASRRERGY